jgi:hypothetical protein
LPHLLQKESLKSEVSTELTHRANHTSLPRLALKN